MEKNYDVIVDEICPDHGGRNFSYQYHNENFVRIESVCEGCQTPTRHEPSSDRAARAKGARPQRPLRP